MSVVAIFSKLLGTIGLGDARLCIHGYMSIKVAVFNNKVNRRSVEDRKRLHISCITFLIVDERHLIGNDCMRFPVFDAFNVFFTRQRYFNNKVESLFSA